MGIRKKGYIRVNIQKRETAVLSLNLVMYWMGINRMYEHLRVCILKNPHYQVVVTYCHLHT